MSDCSEIGHNFVLGLMNGVAVYGCNRGCGDVQPLSELSKEDIIKEITKHLKTHDCFVNGE